MLYSKSARRLGLETVSVLSALLLASASSQAQPQQSTARQLDRRTGGHSRVLNPYKIPKYQIDLVFPGVMKHNEDGPNHYDIAVREFKQQILPGGKWCKSGGRDSRGVDCGALKHLDGPTGYPPTTVWSYGPQQDPVPVVAPDIRTHVSGRRDRPLSQFNYPAFTMETTANKKVHVKWVNELVEINKKTGRPYRVGDRRRKYLEHILPLDQTLHWANPSQECFFYAKHGGPGPARGTHRTDCAGRSPDPYAGPVPIVTHVHGSHVDPDSDGYPEAWWLPRHSNTQYNDKGHAYAMSGSLFDDATGRNPGDLGYAHFEYRNDQPATTLWFHDHSLGITRLNVYAGPAAFWLIRGGRYDRVDRGGRHDRKDRGRKKRAVLPGPAPKAGQSTAALNSPGRTRQAIREIPVLIQDRTFLKNGDLFYPGNRAFFETLNQANTPKRHQQFNITKLKKLNKGCGPDEPNCRITVPGSPNFIKEIGKLMPDPDRTERDFPLAPPKVAQPAAYPGDFREGSMMPPIWNTEAFFNTIVVNGTVWPKLEVARAPYRLRFLNGSNARTYNLSLWTLPEHKKCEDVADFAGESAKERVPGRDDPVERPIFQIGSDGGFLPQVVEITPGHATRLPGDGTRPARQQTVYPQQALLMAPAERADTIIDFTDLENGTKLCLVNTGPDSPFGGFIKPDPPADPKLTGQVMQFVVNKDLNVKRDAETTSPYKLMPVSKPVHVQADAKPVKISLNERATDFPISWLNVCVDGPHKEKKCASDSDCNQEPGSCKIELDRACTNAKPCRTGDSCEYYHRCGMDVDLTMTETGEPTTGNFAVCARVECTYPDNSQKLFSLPASGFEGQNPCAVGDDPYATINILGLTVENVPTGVDACSNHNVCALGELQGHRCSSDADCNPHAKGTCSGASAKACKKDTDCPEMDVCQLENPTSTCILAAPYGPMVDLLGTVKEDSAKDEQGIPLRWTDDSGISRQVPITMQDGSVRKVGVTEYPGFGETQSWEIYNFTPDAHPIHIHLVQFNVLDRQPILSRDSCTAPLADGDACYDPDLKGVVYPQEDGWKDTVIAHPSQITKVQARFDIEGLYVWHCHILEHEDNEMMRPFVVQGPKDDDDDDDRDDRRRGRDRDDDDDDGDDRRRGRDRDDDDDRDDHRRGRDHEDDRDHRGRDGDDSRWSSRSSH